MRSVARLFDLVFAVVLCLLVYFFIFSLIVQSI